MQIEKELLQYCKNNVLPKNMNEYQEHDDWTQARTQMIENQIRRRGITHQPLLEAMTAIPRELFVPRDHRKSAYEDRALSTTHDQTISQPYMVAYMTQKLDISTTSRILEIGTGTGYQTAILARLGQHVYTVERCSELKNLAEVVLAQLTIQNISFHFGDGSIGWTDHAPYDRIIVTAGAPKVPTPLIEQLVEGGKMVLPVGNEKEQIIVLIERKGDRIVETPLIPCRFVKLIGQQGWETDDQSPTT